VSGLIRILEKDTDALQCLDAAKALAQLGDERGVDYLIAALDVPDIDVRLTAKKYILELDNRRGIEALKSHLETSKHPTHPGVRTKLDAKYPFLTAYVGFFALSILAAFLVGLLPLPTFLRYIVITVIAFYVFKYVVQKNILPYT